MENFKLYRLLPRFAPDGINTPARVDVTTQRQLYTKVVDQILNYPSLYARFVSQGSEFEGKTEDVTYDISADTQGQFFTSLETLSSSAVSTAVTGSFAHTAYTQPIVSIMLEAFANVGSLGIINLDDYKYEKAAGTAMTTLGSAIYGSGTAAQPLGLTAIDDDGTNVATIGGLSRATYTALVSTLTAYASGKLTLATMATQYDSANAPGAADESPNVGWCTAAIFSDYEALLTPFVRQSYRDVGYDKMRTRDKYASRNQGELRSASGFNALSYRDTYIIRDFYSTAQMLWFLNEKYIEWKGRAEIPAEYEDTLEKVDFGESTAYEGTGAIALEAPSEWNGWFYQKPLTIPDQAGRIARFYAIGQTIPKSFRRHSKGTGITGV
jgi:hypothetical protein